MSSGKLVGKCAHFIWIVVGSISTNHYQRISNIDELSMQSLHHTDRIKVGKQNDSAGLVWTWIDICFIINVFLNIFGQKRCQLQNIFTKESRQMHCFQLLHPFIFERCSCQILVTCKFLDVNVGIRFSAATLKFWIIKVQHEFFLHMPKPQKSTNWLTWIWELWLLPVNSF